MNPQTPSDGPARSERAASLVEYALLVALIAVVALSAMQLLGTAATDSLNTSGSSIFN